jgi:alpha-1,2-mannosyltransferase
VIPLHTRHLLAPECYPRLTMARQALGSVRVVGEALKQLVPELFIDTTGWAFPYPLVRLAGARVAAYVHYPTVSTDMLDRVHQRRALYNNSDEVTGSWARSTFKLGYYHVMALVYGASGSCANVRRDRGREVGGR